MTNSEERMRAALDLLRFKALVMMTQDGKLLNEDDVNEVLTVAGLPVIIPEELNYKEIEVM